MRQIQEMKRRLRYQVIRGGLEFSALKPVGALFKKVAGRGVIFTLHHVRPSSNDVSFDPNAILSITPDFLEKAITTSLEQGLTPVHLHELPTLLEDRTDDRKFVAFTLDDGYRNNAQYAAPIFNKYKAPYTIFITPGFVEREQTLWWEVAADIVRECDRLKFDFGHGTETVELGSTFQKVDCFNRIAASVEYFNEADAVKNINDVARRELGIEPIDQVDELVMNSAELLKLKNSDNLVHFGAHTLSHINLRRVSQSRLKEEIEGSRKKIIDYISEQPRSFSYPYGWSRAVGEREINALRNDGQFDIAVTTQPGVLQTGFDGQDRFAVPRVSLNGLFQKKKYVRALISGIPFKLL